MTRAITLVAVVATILSVPAATGANPGQPAGGESKRPLTLAVIGDTPYSDDQIATFPALVEHVNADPKVRTVLHLGDIKNGSSPCSDERLTVSRDLYETFKDPFVYTPGDNEWTDCHRAAAGGYLPTERLARLRELFFPEPGWTLGERSKRVVTQAEDPGFAAFVENQLWTQSQVVFSAVHVVGSRNGLDPWFGAAETPEQRELRLEEYRARLAADLAWLDRSFAIAEEERARGVVLAMQADTFAGARDAFAPIVERVEALASRFGRPVLLLQGDTHRYLVDRPLAGAPNLTRIVVEGETAAEWLRLRIDPGAGELFTWERERL